MAAETPPLVLRLGAEPLHAELDARGLDVHVVGAVSELIRPDDTLAPRAIVLGPPADDGLDWQGVIPRIRASWPLVDVVLWNPRATPEVVRDALHAGVRDVVLDRSPQRACDVLVEIIERQQLLPRTQSEAAPTTDEGFEGMIARSRAMFDLFETAAQVAQSSAAVLILGETGTGKELLARAIHKRSRRDGRFVALNCAAVPETLIDSELFGHVEGAFTGATQPKPGLFRHAEGGTLLLDEAGNVPLPVQYRLLRVLQEGAVRPVGGAAEIPVDVRVIAATSASLEEDVRAGRFREDLFYRLDVIRLVIPPLRERPDDIIFLFAHFARRFADAYRIPRPTVTDGFLDALVSHAWPGNVRQLENFTERLVLTEADTMVDSDRFHDLVAFRSRGSGGRSTPASPVLRDGPGRPELPLDKPLEDALQPHIEALERAYLEGVLTRTSGRVSEAAEQAGISRRTLSRMLKRLQIDKMDFRERR
mgnify:CR=1 FL=1